MRGGENLGERERKILDNVKEKENEWKWRKWEKNGKAAVDIIGENKHDTKQKKEEQKEHVSMMNEVKEVKSTGWGTVVRLVHLQS